VTVVIETCVNYSSSNPKINCFYAVVAVQWRFPFSWDVALQYRVISIILRQDDSLIFKDLLDIATLENGSTMLSQSSGSSPLVTWYDIPEKLRPPERNCLNCERNRQLRIFSSFEGYGL